MFLETARLEREDWQEERRERAVGTTPASVIPITHPVVVDAGACEQDAEGEEDAQG